MTSHGRLAHNMPLVLAHATRMSQPVVSHQTHTESIEHYVRKLELYFENDTLTVQKDTHLVSARTMV
jgi:hypothetical protein